ncbi:MAG: hypothetical protein KAJ18_12635, partial [Candidatus Omnitrophica bacterium]|nr:hypothetical protein [Candidatus Omnitrophota bacterium]
GEGGHGAGDEARMNDWKDFNEVRNKFGLKICLHCRRPLKAYVRVDGESWWQEYLVCDECEYANDMSR